MQVYDDFEVAKLAAVEDEQDLVVNGCYRSDGNPAYFLAPPDASAQWMTEVSFEIHHGKPMDDYVRFCLQQAKARA